MDKQKKEWCIADSGVNHRSHPATARVRYPVAEGAGPVSDSVQLAQMVWGKVQAVTNSGQGSRTGR
jgi:hypothetical protein